MAPSHEKSNVGEPKQVDVPSNVVEPKQVDVADGDFGSLFGGTLDLDSILAGGSSELAGSLGMSLPDFGIPLSQDGSSQCPL